MISYAAEFPVRQTGNLVEVTDTIKTWLLGSPHTRLTNNQFERLGQQDKFELNSGFESLYALRSADNGTEYFGVRYQKTTLGIEWTTTIVLSRQPSSSWISVRVACDAVSPSAELPKAKPPVILRLLVEKLGGGVDGSLEISERPQYLRPIDVQVAADCLLGKNNLYLPVVYISVDFSGNYLVNPSTLAKSLLGMAHVLVEPDRNFSVELKHASQSQNVYGGTVGIYWPDQRGRRLFFLNQETSTSRAIEDAIILSVRTALCNRRPLSRCAWSSVNEAYAKGVVQALKMSGSTELEAFMAAFDDEVKAKDVALQEAESEISRLTQALLESESEVRPGEIRIFTGDERDFFEDEILAIALEAFEMASRNVTPDSRRQHILLSLCKENYAYSGAAERRDSLKKILRGYTSMTSTIKKELVGLGFSVSDVGKHIKLTYANDDRYTVTLPKSGSDVRGGLNASAKISQLLF